MTKLQSAYDALADLAETNPDTANRCFGAIRAMVLLIDRAKSPAMRARIEEELAEFLDDVLRLA
jgi:hypothetical protein